MGGGISRAASTAWLGALGGVEGVVGTLFLHELIMGAALGYALFVNVHYPVTVAYSG